MAYASQIGAMTATAVTVTTTRAAHEQHECRYATLAGCVYNVCRRILLWANGIDR